jgi:nitrous-oxide reductase
MASAGIHGKTGRRYWSLAALGVAAALALAACNRSADLDEPQDAQKGDAKTAVVATGAGTDGLQAIAAQRGLSPDDVLAAVKTYTPSGKTDDFVMFASGGHSGQVFAIGVPSMRILRSIAVFTPEPWQGWGYPVGRDVMDQGKVDGVPLSWGDTHHPGLSETNGEYDGQFLFINDKANARVAVIDLRDWVTKQIVKNPIILNDHGGTMVTPNTDYIIEGGQYGAPLGWTYASIADYQKAYRGAVTFWKFDRSKGRIDTEQSFAIELPPYGQDIFTSGKQVSEGWVFGNSFNTEMATGGIEEGKPPLEAGASQRDMDYMHIINLKAAVEDFKAGKFERVKGFAVIRLTTAIKDNLLFFAPEPKSPHGVDVTPKGEYVIVSGKLDPHVTIYSFAKMQQAIKDKKYQQDQFGVPVLDYDSVREAQVEVGLGPLHTQFDDKGYAYTSLFLDSAVARWTLGGAYSSMHPEQPWQLVTKIPVQYNVGHICIPGGDTVKPDGKYLVSLNKWSIDRFLPTGPLLPQNLQLIDISQGGDKMQMLYDMPMGIGEPHYAQMIRADKLHPYTVYPEVGWSDALGKVDPDAAQPGKERVERRDGAVHVYMTAVRSHFNPEHVTVNKGDKVVWHITNVERTQDATHGFAISGYNINLSIEPSRAETFEFIADRAGVYPFYCTEFCSALHLEMQGYLLVKPAPDVAAK